MNISPLLLKSIRKEDRVDLGEPTSIPPSPEFSPSVVSTPAPPSPSSPADSTVRDPSLDICSSPSSTSFLLDAVSAHLAQLQPLSRRERRKAETQQRKKKAKLAEQIKNPLFDRKTRHGTSNKYSKIGKKVVVKGFKIEGSNLARASDIGRHRPADKEVPTLEEVMADPDFKYEKYDGT